MTRGRPHPLHYRLPERLKKARQAAGVTRQGVSVSAGLSSNTAYYIEEEQRVPGIDVVEKLARAMARSPGWLAYGLEELFSVPEEPCYPGLSARLRQTREAAGLGVRELARSALTSDTTILNAESGRTLPSVATIEQLADALDVSPAWLAYGEGPQVIRRRRARTSS